LHLPTAAAHSARIAFAYFDQCFPSEHTFVLKHLYIAIQPPIVVDLSERNLFHDAVERLPLIIEAAFKAILLLLFTDELEKTAFNIPIIPPDRSKRGYRW
jgi:hypothetical protein